MNMIQIEKAGQSYNLYFDDCNLKVTSGSFQSKGIALTVADADAMEKLIAEEVSMSQMEFAMLKKQEFMPC